MKFKFNVNLEDLRKLGPCYEPSTKLGDNWSGTLLDILEDVRIPNNDKIWAVTKLLDDKTARLFAVYCAREALKNIKGKIDVRITNCIEVSARFAVEQATDAQRSAARSAAYAAADAAAADAAAAYAAAAAAYAADAAKRDEVLSDFAEAVVQILIEMNAPGCQWLDIAPIEQVA